MYEALLTTFCSHNSTVLVGSTTSRVISSQLQACLIEWRDGSSPGTITTGNAQLPVNLLQRQHNYYAVFAVL